MVLTVWAVYRLIASAVEAGNDAVIQVGEFSSAKSGQPIPKAWQPLTFKDIQRHTRYTLVDDNGTAVVLAEADGSASGLIQELEADPGKYPVVQWRWKVPHVLEKGDVHRKSGDDYPARLYITFALESDKLGFLDKLKYRAVKLVYGRYPPSKSINYIWANKAPKGTMVPNPYTDKAMMFVVESGVEKAGRWVQEERHIYHDFKLAFGMEPPLISGVAIMTDADDTGESAKAYYGDILLKSAGRPME